MTALDILVILLLGLNAWIGFRRGFVHEVFALAALIAAIVVVRLFHAPASVIAQDYVGNASGAAMLSFAILFGVTLAVGKFIAHRIGERSRSSFIGPFDRAIGVGFGLVKGLVIATVLFLLASLAYNTVYGRNADRPAWMTDSRSYALLNASGIAITDLIEQQRKEHSAS